MELREEVGIITHRLLLEVSLIGSDGFLACIVGMLMFEPSFKHFISATSQMRIKKKYIATFGWLSLINFMMDSLLN